MKIKAVYPGTFDPITNGHTDLIRRAARLFDEVVIAVSTHPSKTPLFSVPERVEMIQQVTQSIDNVTVKFFDGLLIHYVEQQNAQVVIRGLRAVSDFEYEFQMASMNRKLDDSIETVFLTPSEQNTFLSSSMVREIARLKGDVSSFVAPEVEQALIQRFGELHGA